MGLHILTHIHQVDDIVIDIAACNAELRNSEFQQLYDGVEDGRGYMNKDYPLRLKNNTLQILYSGDGYIENWGNHTMDYGLFVVAANIISKHLTSGKIVFFQEIEGNMPKFYIVTPGNVEIKKLEDLKF